MAHTIYDRTIAFAGLCQAVSLVQQIAKDGYCDTNAFETSIRAILQMNPSNTIEVFQSESHLQVGLRCLVEQLIHTPSSSALTRYLISLMSLERKLYARRDALAQLGDRISTLERQATHFELLEPQMLENIASVYLDVISPLGPRIQVSGTPSILQQTINQHKIRAILLAGIRSAVLWRQVGGKRRHLIFGRKKMVEQAKILLARHS